MELEDFKKDLKNYLDREDVKTISIERLSSFREGNGLGGSYPVLKVRNFKIEKYEK